MSKVLFGGGATLVEGGVGIAFPVSEPVGLDADPFVLFYIGAMVWPVAPVMVSARYTWYLEEAQAGGTEVDLDGWVFMIGLHRAF